jgi:hypothetical protein
MENLPQKILPQSVAELGLPQVMLNKWQELAIKGHFEEEKAAKCLELSTTDFSQFLACSLEKAINSTASLATINKYLGEEARYNLLEENLAIINELVPAKNKISKPMIAVLINRLTRSYSYLTISEIIHALSEGLSGVYGDVSWGAIGMADLTSWIDSYENIRRQKLEEQQRKQSSENNKTPFNSRYGGNENPFAQYASQAKALREQIEAQALEMPKGKGWGQRIKERLGNAETEGQISE